MKNFFYSFLQAVIISATIVFSFWLLEEGTKRSYTPNWIDLLCVWTIVLWIVSILSVIYKKKLLHMTGKVISVVILCVLLVAGTLIDTYYTINILFDDIVIKSKINQALLCLVLWVMSVCLILMCKKMILKNK